MADQIVTIVPWSPTMDFATTLDHIEIFVSPWMKPELKWMKPELKSRKIKFQMNTIVQLLKKK